MSVKANICIQAVISVVRGTTVHQIWLAAKGAGFAVRSPSRAGCSPLTDITTGSFPSVGLVIPELCHDAHDCGLATADTWVAD